MSDGEGSTPRNRGAIEAAELLEQLRCGGELPRSRGKTVVAEHQASVMRALERSWALDTGSDAGMPDTEPGA
jgi:hypothetical protein